MYKGQVHITTKVTYRVSHWLLYVLGLYTGCHLSCYGCIAFIQGVTLVVMCVLPLYMVSPWLL
jgi:hypothetical protein